VYSICPLAGFGTDTNIMVILLVLPAGLDAEINDEKTTLLLEAYGK
jgi:hypothetical protein